MSGLMRHDTWGEGLAAHLAGNPGWSKIRPAYTGVEIQFQHWWTEPGQISVSQAAGQFVSVPYAINNQSGFPVTFDDLMCEARRQELEVCLNVNAQQGWPYHHRPKTDREDYYPFESADDRDRYVDTVVELVRMYPWVDCVEVMNEPYYQYGNWATPNPEKYDTLVQMVSSVVPNHITVLAASELLPRPVLGCAVGKHDFILHNTFNGDDLYNGIVDSCKSFALLFPRQERWLDETMFVGRLPGGTTTDAGARLVSEGCCALQEAYDRGHIHQAGLGFAGGISPVYSQGWGVAGTYVHPDGTLTKGAYALINIAKEIGWWQSEYEDTTPPPPPPEEDPVSEAEAQRALSLIEKALSGCDNVLEDQLSESAARKVRRQIRKKLRQARTVIEEALDK